MSINYYKKYLKYKNKYHKLQFGGDLHEYSVELGEYPKCIDLLNQVYPNFSEVKYNKYVKDDVFERTIQNDVYGWYKTKNPRYLLMKDIDPNMPEFECIIAGILKDLYILKSTKQFPLSGKNPKRINEEKKKINYIEDFDKQITNLLNSIDELILNNFHYVKSIEIIYDYLFLFYDTFNSFFFVQKEQFLNLIKTPYIVYPSFIQISYYKKILTFGAPFINFKLSNNTHYVERDMHSTIFEISHNVFSHHGFISFRPIYQLSNININLNNISTLFTTTEYINIFRNHYNTMSVIIKDLQPYINYVIPFNQIQTSTQLFEHQDIKKYVLACIIFIHIHEQQFFSNKDYNNIKRIISTNTNVEHNLKEYFKLILEIKIISSFLYINMNMYKYNPQNIIDKNTNSIYDEFKKSLLGNAEYAKLVCENKISSKLKETLLFGLRNNISNNIVYNNKLITVLSNIIKDLNSIGYIS